jgi:hypothetical protein
MMKTNQINILGYDSVQERIPLLTMLHLVVVVGLVRLCDPESNAGGRLTTSSATHAGKVKG